MRWVKGLSDRDVCQARKDYAAGECTQMQLAAKYGVSQPSISHMLAGKTYKHVECDRGQS